MKLDQQHYGVIGLGYGDEGKGHIVNWLVRNAHIGNVVRYGGGPQAAHNVVEPDGTHHCFSQFGSGSLVGAKTILSDQMIVDPLAFETEADILAEKISDNPYNMALADPNLTVITPFHKMYGQMLEMSRGANRHSSCGIGFGQAVFGKKTGDALNLTLGDFHKDGQLVRKKLAYIHESMRGKALKTLEQCDSREMMRRMLQFEDRDLFEMVLGLLMDTVEKMNIGACRFDDDHYIFESSQGALLDYDHGFWPHVTKSRIYLPTYPCTLYKIGVIRSYQTRHGNGLFITEEPKLQDIFAEMHNETNEWQGGFRRGWLDFVATRYAIKVAGGVDTLAVTHLDYLKHLNIINVCLDYWYNGEVDDFFKENFEYVVADNGNVTVTDIIFKDRSRDQRDELVERLKMCTPRYRFVKAVEDFLIDEIEKEVGVKVSIRSHGPTYRDINTKEM